MKKRPPRRRRYNFDFNVKRRKEIVLHARLVEAAETEDFDRWLIAWHWHNPKAKDPIWSLMEAAKRMGGRITEAEADMIIEEAAVTRECFKADDLARFLGLRYAQRQALGITTIGSIDVKKRAREVLRKRETRLRKERKRRERGMRPQSKSLSRAQPWRDEGISRPTWYRRNKAGKQRETTLSAACLVYSEDRTVSKVEFEGETGLSERATAAISQHGQGQSPDEDIERQVSSPSGNETVVADRYASLPVELRLLALGLPLPNGLARAA
jgi:hypothetical protein